MRRASAARRIWTTGGALGLALLAGLLLSSRPARADIDVHFDIGGAPPPPRIVFHARPHEVFVPEEKVWVVDDPNVGDNDCFRYGGYYWVFREGYWYRSARYRGPFRVIAPRYVPQAIYRVPGERWKHRAHVVEERHEVRGHGRGHEGH